MQPSEMIIKIYYGGKEMEKWLCFDNHSHVTATQPLTGNPYLRKKLRLELGCRTLGDFFFSCLVFNVFSDGCQDVVLGGKSL